MDAIELQRLVPPPTPPVITGAPYQHTQPELEAPPFEGQVQRDAFVHVEVDADEALRSFIERARTISTVRGDSLQIPQLPARDPKLASPFGPA